MAPSALAGKRVVITRPALQSESLVNALNECGAIPIVQPLITFSEPEDFSPLDTAISRLEQIDWLVFTSGEAVRAVARRCSKLGRNLAETCSDLSVATVGPVTAEEVKKTGLQVDYLAQAHSGLGLANELGERLRGKKVLLPRSDRANPDLPQALIHHGAEVTEVIAYRTLKPSEIEREKLTVLLNGNADAILFFSPSAVLHFAEEFGSRRLSAIEDKMVIGAVGPVTANALRQAGVSRAVVAADTTAAAVMEALEKHFAGAGKAAPAGVKQR
jgi:uroporphyrinogen III methyltransferase/synthase